MRDNKTYPGQVIDCLPGTEFKVQLEDGAVAQCTLAGRMYLNHIRVILGDRVEVVLSPDRGRGRIVRRF